MLSGAVVNRYARGLLAYAEAHHALDFIDAQLRELGAMIQVSSELDSFLASPVFSTELKLSTIDKLLKGTVRGDVRNFIAILLERGRGTYIAAIARRFHEIVDEVHGRLEVEIEAAQPLTQKQTEAIVAALAAAFGKEIRPSIRENRDLIAGYRIQVGNRVLDATTQSALRQFRESLLAGVVRREGTR